MHKAPTNKPNDRQRWATPEWFVRALEAMTGRTIEVDLAAEPWSAKAPEWLGPGSTIAEDAFEVVWVDFWATAFLNPPFRAIGPWVERLIEQADRGLVTFLLVLKVVRSALGQTFYGYKGGEYEMRDWVDVYLAKWGDCGEGLGPVTLALMFGVDP